MTRTAYITTFIKWGTIMKKQITITAPDGIEKKLLCLDRFMYKQNEYIIFEKEGGDDVVIYRIKDLDDKYEEVYSIGDEKLLAKIYNEFKKRNPDYN